MNFGTLKRSHKERDQMMNEILDKKEGVYDACERDVRKTAKEAFYRPAYGKYTPYPERFK